MRTFVCLTFIALMLVGAVNLAGDTEITCGSPPGYVTPGGRVSPAGPSASITRISLDPIPGIISTAEGDLFPAGGVLRFPIRYTNTSDSGFNVDNMWIISSPDGASWQDSATMLGNYKTGSAAANLGPIGIDTTGQLSKALFPSTYSIRTFSTISGPPVKADGLSPDTVEFQGAGNDVGLGLPPHTDARFMYILIRTNLEDTGKSICIDSSMRCPPT